MNDKTKKDLPVNEDDFDEEGNYIGEGANPEVSDTIVAAPVNLKNLSKQELISLLEQKTTAEKLLVEEAEQNKAISKRYVDTINAQQKAFDETTKRAEQVIRVMSNYHADRTKAVFTILDSVKVLMSEPDFNGKGE